MLTLYRQALARRRAEPALGDGLLRWLDSPGTEVLDFARDGGALVCAVNMGGDPARIPAYGELLLASGPLSGDVLPPDTAAWFRCTT